MTLTDSDIQSAMADLPGWEYADGAISKTYEFPQYLAGLAFATAAGTVCEGLGHHPDMTIGYRRVQIALTTHDAGNAVTQKDIDAALAIERIGYP
ncbi:MAG: 4a-hydroxytetrahydrobiopterin dehydratase [Anaerolineaceae bacterium]|nr:MAG: 4a-hydroxytetrahydrobiopterin dehydratase [Anaerolineaceae bacterium]